jgi:hypothetical protein
VADSVTKSKPRKKTRRVAAVVAAPPPTAVNVEVVDNRIKVWTPRVVFVSASIAAIVAGYGAYKWLGLPTLVVDSTLHQTIGNVERTLRTQIGETKDVVIDHSNKNTTAVKDDVSKVSKLLSDVARRQDQGTIERLEMQQTLIELARSDRMTSLSSVDAQLGTRKTDVYLQERKRELTRAVGDLDKELERVREQIRKARTP